MRLVWLVQARADPRAIIEYIATDNPIAAIVNDEKIANKADHLIEHPRIGKLGRLKGTRELIVKTRIRSRSHGTISIVN